MTEAQIRLAYERGFLTQKSLNYFQNWALLYHYYLQRRDKLEDIDTELERQTFNLAYDRWLLLYKDRMLGAAGGPAEDDGVELELDDLSELDRFMAEQERQFQDALTGTHTMSGADASAPIDWRSAQPEQWGPWQ